MQLMLLLFKSCHSQWILFGNIFASRFPAVVVDGFALCCVSMGESKMRLDAATNIF